MLWIRCRCCKADGSVAEPVQMLCSRFRCCGAGLSFVQAGAGVVE